MALFCFTIYGNQEDVDTGNPIPYTRTTQKSKFGEKYKRYMEWKSYVVDAYSNEIKKDKKRKREFRDISKQIYLHGKPIRQDVRGKVYVAINFGKENHADPDNIIKGILDALFQNDKHIDVSTTHECHSKKPRVYVIIDIKYGAEIK